MMKGWHVHYDSDCSGLQVRPADPGEGLLDHPFP